MKEEKLERRRMEKERSLAALDPVFERKKWGGSDGEKWSEFTWRDMLLKDCSLNYSPCYYDSEKEREKRLLTNLSIWVNGNEYELNVIDSKESVWRDEKHDVKFSWQMKGTDLVFHPLFLSMSFCQSYCKLYQNSSLPFHSRILQYFPNKVTWWCFWTNIFFIFHLSKK